MIIGELKSIGFREKAIYVEDDDVKLLDDQWIKERLYKLERFAQTWWPYYDEIDLKEKVLHFRQQFQSACSFDPSTNQTNINPYIYWDSAEELQRIVSSTNSIQRNQGEA